MLRILLLDDNPNDRLLVIRELQQAFSDLEILAAIDSDSFFAQLATDQLDLVITDYQLRWSNGLEVLTVVKTRYPDCPVIMFTDSGNEEVAVLGMKQGLSDYLPKRQPFHRLAIAVREAILKQQMQRDYAAAMLALKASEEQFRLAMEAAELGFWDWDVAGDRVTWSYNQVGLFGAEPTRDRTYADFLAQVHPDDQAMVQYAIDRAIEQNSDYDVEFRVVWPDDSVHWLASKGRVYRNDRGEAIRMIGVVRDTTDRRLAEEALRHQTRELSRLNRIKDEFLAVLSHELRSPLNPILGWAKLLQTRKYDEVSTLRALKTIERNARLQTQLVEDLLDVSRIMQGKLSLNVESVNLIDCIAAAIDTMRFAAEAKSIVIETSFDRSIPAIPGDPNRLQQVMWNLLSNAIKFTPNRGRVEIRLEAIEDPQGSTPQAQIIVSDTGIGIPAAFLPHVFEYFCQEDASISRSHGGLGLGLAIVRHLVELHGGTISAASLGAGQGATFTITLSLKSNLIPLTFHSQAESPNLQFLAGRRILIVDDELDSRDFLQLLLKGHGAKVIAADSAAAAIAALGEFQPDLLISDVGMPETDGYALMRQIRALPNRDRLSAIALTAYAREEDAQKAVQAGFQQHLPKPVDPDRLIAAIAQLLKLQ
ncbi:response regulator [Microcoleus sp. FACHB-1515]|uniref:ATP-binding response regulator n=1 Tax=Cyanophyceae TaxID=3028117 RepID=UPI0016898AD6|nr:response regulator [Microcoleus sp. FACHB-1515]MBD2090048.1 response regulator [Microcoleus sp. FACHB-1515]